MHWFSKASQASVDDLARRLKAVEDDLALLEAKHNRLRGRFYASTGVDQPPSPQSKAEVLRAFGVVPGQPVHHK